MWLRRLSISFVASAVSLLLGCQAVNHSSSSSSVSSGEILYVVDNGNVTTYSIDPASLQPSVAETPVNLLPASSSSLLQFVPAPNDNSVYVLWSDSGQQEHLSTYSTDPSGVPQVPAIQTLDVSSLSQLNIHPSGKFAYAMQVQGSYGPFTSTIFLFHIRRSGMLQPKGQVLSKYGPSPTPTLLYGMTSTGTELYLGSDQQKGPVYWERSVNKQTGTLAAQVLLLSPPIQDTTVFGTSLIIDYQNSLNTAPPRYVTVFPNTPNPRKHLIQCGSAMLSACGDASNVQLDPSGQYLFMTDPASQQVRVGHINLAKHTIEDTGNFLPLTAQTPGFSFSPDGKFVYALLASDLSIHIFSFDRTTGILTEGSTTIPIPASAGFAPALR